MWTQRCRFGPISTFLDGFVKNKATLPQIYKRTSHEFALFEAIIVKNRRLNFFQNSRIVKDLATAADTYRSPSTKTILH